MFQPVGQSNNLDVDQFKQKLSQFSIHLRNVVIRRGVSAALRPIQQRFVQISRSHRQKKDPVFRRDRATKTLIVRPHFNENIITKVWRITDGTGYIGFVGAPSKEAPHAHLLENGTGPRFTKTGAYRGSMPAFYILSTTIAASIEPAKQAFESEVRTGIQNFEGQF
jgi:hypothetical protein